MKKPIIILAVLIASLFSPACSTISEHQTGSRLAVKGATVLYLKKHPDRAPRVIELATFLEANAGSTTALTVAALDAAVREKIHFDELSPGEKVLVDELIVMIRDELVAQLGAGELSGEDVLIVKQVAGWIRDTAILMQP